MAERPRLAPSRNAYHHQTSIGGVQYVWGQSHLFQGVRPVVLDQYMRVAHHRQQYVLSFGGTQVEAYALLIPAVDLPVGINAVGEPGAQRIALWRLDLDDVGAEIR